MKLVKESVFQGPHQEEMYERLIGKPVEDDAGARIGKITDVRVRNGNTEVIVKWLYLASNFEDIGNAIEEYYDISYIGNEIILVEDDLKELRNNYKEKIEDLNRQIEAINDLLGK